MIKSATMPAGPARAGQEAPQNPAAGIVATGGGQPAWRYQQPFLPGAAVWNRRHECIGRVTAVLTDDGGAPDYVAVRTNGLLPRCHLMPLAGASFGGVRLIVDHPRRLVTSAPRYTAATLAEDTRGQLRRHYNTAA